MVGHASRAMQTDAEANVRNRHQAEQLPAILSAFVAREVPDGTGDTPDARRGRSRLPSRRRTRVSTLVMPILAGEVMAGLGRVVLLRRRTYELFSLAFRLPEPRGVLRVVRDGPLVLEQILDVAPFRALEEARSLLGDLADNGPPMGALCRELSRERERLLSDGDGVPAACESIQRSEAARAAVRQSVQSSYRSAGFSPGRSMSDPTDHLCVELAFVAELCRRQFRTLAEGSGSTADRLAEMQRRFLEEHLGLWAPAFAQDLRTQTSNPFYRAVALALPVWLGLDRGFLRTLLDAPPGGDG